MHLLDLPVEIIREILYKLDPQSFYTILSTAKHFREHALGSTHLLLAQLARVPGHRVIPQRLESNSERLLANFCRNATQHLLHGADRMTDVHVWRSERNVDRKTSGILSWEREKWGSYNLPIYPYEKEMLVLAEVEAKQGTVRLYPIKDGQPLSEQQCITTNMLSVHLPAYSQNSPFHFESTTYRVVKVMPALDRRYPRDWCPMIAILYEPVASDNADWKLIYMAIDESLGPIVNKVFSIEPQGRTFIDVAINIDGDPFLVWKNHKERSAPPTFVASIHYHTGAHGHACDACSKTSTFIDMYPNEPISRVWTQGESVHLLPNSIPMPRFSGNKDDIDDSFHPRPRFTHLPKTTELFSAPGLGRTLATYHHCEVQVLDLFDGEPTCVNTALQLVITRDLKDQEQVRTGAYLLKGLDHSGDCMEFDRDERHINMSHIFVAQLAGLPNLYQLSSLGLAVAVSPQSKRIAIASWKTLLIYALEPEAFLDPIFSLCKTFDPKNEADRARQKGVSGDYAFIEDCGWQFYENAPRHEGCVVLEPVRLESDNVIRQLEWKNENELWGWSDRGLIRWGIGAAAKGERGCVDLKDWVRVPSNDEEKTPPLPLQDFTYLKHLEDLSERRRRAEDFEALDFEFCR